MNRDLTEGTPSRVLWRFCLPLFGSVLFQQMYNIADSLVAGKFIGEEALAAVGNGYEITLVFLAFAFGCNIGCSVIVSKLFGGKRYGELKTAVSTTVISVSLLTALLMLVGFVFCEDLLQLINTPSSIINDSALYLKIYIFGLPFVMFYNISNGIFSALGDSKTPFFLLAASSSANVFADILFVKVFGMKVDGVAWATFICQGVSCIVAFVLMLWRVHRLPTQDKSPLFSKKQLAEIAVIAIPSIFQQSFISVGNVIIQGLINSFGTSVIAGFSASIKLNSIVTSSFTTIGNGISNFTSQNIGAGKNDRVKGGFAAGIKMVVLICLPIVLLYLLFGRYFIHFFMTAPTKEALDTGEAFLRIVAPFYFVVATKLVADGILRGSGMMKKFMIATFIDLFIRVLVAILLSKYTSLGSFGIWISWPIGWVIATVISVAFYKTSYLGKKKLEAVAEV